MFRHRETPGRFGDKCREGIGWIRLLARCVGGDARPACAAPLDSIDDAKITTMHTIVPRDRKAAIVLAAVKGEALARRPDGRP